MTTTDELNLDLHRNDFAYLFGQVRSTKEDLRTYAQPFARMVLGDQFIDDTHGWLGWEVAPVYGPDSVLIGVDFRATTQDDRGPATVKTTRIDFAPPPVAKPDSTKWIDAIMLTTARDLCADSGETNPEYVRGCAEMLIDATMGLNQDEHKDDLIAWLGSPLDRSSRS